VAAARDGGGDLPHPPKMKRKHYERELLALQIELVKAQYWVKEAGDWDAYTDAAASMFAATHTPAAPWAVVNSNDKRTARINAIRHVLHALPYDGKDPDVAVEADPAIVAPPSQAGTRRSRAPAPAHP
jgi:polyphosphate kinase 2 (PPK2 family)